MAATPFSPETRFAILDRLHNFYALVDAGRAGSTVDLFSEDALLTFGPGSPQPGTIGGTDIRAAMAAREKQSQIFTRHCVSNVALAGEGDRMATARYILVLYRSDDETRNSIPAFVADVEEQWVEFDDGWRIARRTILPTFTRP